MRRLPSGYADAISAALDLLPPRIRARVEHVDFLCGVDPGRAGLHGFREHTTIPARFDRDPHYVPAEIQTRPTRWRHPTVVLPQPPFRRADWSFVVVHELGHALDDVLGAPIAAPAACTEYATANRAEAFAEALCCWLRLPLYHRCWNLVDQQTAALFASL